MNSVYDFTKSLEANLGVSGNLNERTGDDVIVNAELKMLFASAVMGTSLSVEKGTQFQKIIATAVKGYSGGKVKLSVAQLEKMMAVSFDGFSQLYNKKMTQEALGLETSYEL
jgi:hypothetical protein